jgi:hypothetical protein
VITSTIQILRTSLKSKEVREKIGTRLYDASAALTQNDSEPGLLQRIFNIGAKFVGFLIKTVFFAVQWTFTELWEIAIEIFYEIKYFDWNQTDAELKQQIDSNNQRIAQAFGSLIGAGLVWTTGIAIAGGLSFKFPVLAGRVALALADEAQAELRGQLGSLIVTTRQAVISSAILGGLLTLRRLKVFGLQPITKPRDPWILADKIEEKVQSIDNSLLRSFTTGFLDQLEESIIEMGYVVAMTVDDFYAAQKAAQIDDNERTILITPDSQNNDERLILQGGQTGLIQTLQSTLATHVLVHNRDVGQIVGQNYDDWYRAKPFRRNLTLIFKDKDTPPYIKDGKTYKTVTINVPDPKPGLSWEKIKLACEPFTWGPIKVEQKLDNGRKFVINVASLAEGKRVITRMLTLTTAKPQANIRSSQPEQDNLPPDLKIKPTLVYPAYGTLLIREFNYNSQANTYQKNKESATRFDLWTETQPDNFRNLPA